MRIEKHTSGPGDRFAHRGHALRGAADAGLAVHPVWNKSNREHTLIGSRPDDLRALGWRGPYTPPNPASVRGWSSDQYVRTLRHGQACAEYNPSFRQLLHGAFEVAAKTGARCTEALKEHETAIARNVADNLQRRHLPPLFG